MWNYVDLNGQIDAEIKGLSIGALLANCRADVEAL